MGHYAEKGIKRIRVWCLGPGAVKRPHQFWSASPTKERICPACRRIQDQMHLPPMLDRMVRDPDYTVKDC